MIQAKQSQNHQDTKRLSHLIACRLSNFSRDGLNQAVLSGNAVRKQRQHIGKYGSQSHCSNPFSKYDMALYSNLYL